MRIARSISNHVTLAAVLMTAVAALAPAAARADDPATGASTYYVYEAFMGPGQEPGEESETPKAAQKQFAATKPAVPRAQRKSRGYARLRFQRDLNAALLDVELKGVDPADIMALQLQCGAPDGVGPAVVDLGKSVDLTKTFKAGKLSTQRSLDAVATTRVWPADLAFRMTEACPLEPGAPPVSTVAGLEHLARRGLLYLNLRTGAHMFFGEIRGGFFVDR